MLLMIYILNILLFILYALALATVGTLSFIENHQAVKKIFLVISCYFSCWLIDSFIISMTENFTSFENYFSTLYGGSPLTKTFLYLVENLSLLSLLTLFSQRKIRIVEYISIGAITLWMLVAPLFPNHALTVFLFYLPNQLFLIYIGSQFYSLSRQTETSLLSSLSKKLTLLFITFGLLIIAEDSFVIFFIDRYNVLQTVIYYRNFSESTFSIILAVLTIYYAITYFKQPQTSNVNTKEPISDTTQLQQEQHASFGQKYHLTTREQEILPLLLNKQTNQEIADALYLSLGTVKTHIHNIYAKTNVSKRTELFDAFNEFSN